MNGRDASDGTGTLIVSVYREGACYREQRRGFGSDCLAGQKEVSVEAHVSDVVLGNFLEISRSPTRIGDGSRDNDLGMVENEFVDLVAAFSWEIEEGKRLDAIEDVHHPLDSGLWSSDQGFERNLSHCAGMTSWLREHNLEGLTRKVSLLKARSEQAGARVSRT